METKVIFIFYILEVFDPNSTYINEMMFLRQLKL
jgi:hypothetical protein